MTVGFCNFTDMHHKKKNAYYVVQTASVLDLYSNFDEYNLDVYYGLPGIGMCKITVS